MLKILKNLFFSLVFMAWAFVLIPRPVSAQFLKSLNDAATAAKLGGSETHLPIIIGNIVLIVIAFVGVIFLIYIVYAGFLWLTAGGNSEQVKKAGDHIKNGIIGLIIILASYAIVSFVLGNVLESTSL